MTIARLTGVLAGVSENYTPWPSDRAQGRVTALVLERPTDETRDEKPTVVEILEDLETPRGRAYRVSAHVKDLASGGLDGTLEATLLARTKGFYSTFYMDGLLVVAHDQEAPQVDESGWDQPAANVQCVIRDRKGERFGTARWEPWTGGSATTIRNLRETTAAPRARDFGSRLSAIRFMTKERPEATWTGAAGLALIAAGLMVAPFFGGVGLGIIVAGLWAASRSMLLSSEESRVIALPPDQQHLGPALVWRGLEAYLLGGRVEVVALEPTKPR